jgi:Glutathione S-transferase, N-terminal domain
LKPAAADGAVGAGQRSLQADERARLLVLPGSHYCERVLWAVEALRLQIGCEVLAPGLHVMALRRAAPGLVSTHLPVLLHASGAAQGSDAILDLLGCESVEPQAESVLVDFIGPRVRQAFYAALFGELAQARAWVDASYAPAAPWLRRVTGRLPRVMIWSLLRREGASPADLQRLLTTLSDAAATLDDVATAELARIDSNAAAPLSRLAITCGALLAPVMLPAPSPWHGSPWPAHLRPRVVALQALPMWQLARRAWLHRQQTVPGRYPGPDGSACAGPRTRQTRARGLATGGRGNA